MEMETISRKGTVGIVGVPVSLLLKFRGLLVERNDGSGWQPVNNEFERMDAETEIRVRQRCGT